MAGPYGAAGPDAVPELGSKFILDIDGVQFGAVEKVTIPAQEWTVGEDRTSADDLNKGKYSGLHKSGPIVIEKHLRAGGIVDIKKIYDWKAGGSKDRRSGSIALLDREGNELMRWNFKEGWVSKMGDITLDATADDQKVPFIFEISVSEVTAE